MISKTDCILTNNFCFLFFTVLSFFSSAPLSSPSFSLFFHIRKFVLISFLPSSVSLLSFLSIVPSFILMWARVELWLLSRFISFCVFSCTSPFLSLAHVSFYQVLSNLSTVVNVSVLLSQVPPTNVNKPAAQATNMVRIPEPALPLLFSSHTSALSDNYRHCMSHKVEHQKRLFDCGVTLFG